MDSSETRFKAIIVGAGVAGLTLAHCLEKAGIDYVVLDKGVVAPPFGTTITMQPHGLRILHQLGLLDAVLAQCSTMGGCQCRTPDGKSFASNDFFGVVKRNTGYDTRTLDRQLFLRLLYDHLPDKSKVLERARVEQVIEEGDVVRVVLSDGTQHIGDVVVGADGVHSKMREIMWEAANKAVPGYITAEEKRAMTTTYNAIVAACRPVPGLGAHDMEIVSNNKFSFLLLCQPDWISFIVHSKLPADEQCRWPNRRRFSEEQMEALAARMASHPINESVLFGELWRNRTRAQMISLEEGVLDHWFFGRTVLIGDAIHKVTPNSALGGCTAMEDAVAVANVLHAAIAAHPNKKPTGVELRDAFGQYQDSRLPRVREIVKIGGDLTRLQAYDGWKYYLIQRWLTPVVGLDSLAKNIAILCTGAPKLSFVPFTQRRGLLRWPDDHDDTRHVANRNVTADKTKDSRLDSWDGEIEPLVGWLMMSLGVFAAMLWLFVLPYAKVTMPDLGFGSRAGSMEIYLNQTVKT